VSSIGKLGDTYSQNAKTLPEYYAALDAGRLPIQRGIVLTQDDLIRREVIQQIMCHGSIDFTAINTQFQIDFTRYFAHELVQLEALIGDGLVQQVPGHIVVTPEGRLLLRNVAMTFDAYLAKIATPLYSKAI
jgi:oxygen-independent coproporphyrinogen-3 oxidase